MNTPAFDPDDSRLTAYALGESSPAEREEIERLLAESPEARAEVEQIATFARTLEAEYRRENEVYWETRPDEPPPGKIIDFSIAQRRVGWRPALALVWKIAAVIVAFGTLTYFVLRRQSSPHTSSLALSQPAVVAPPPPGEPSRAESSSTADALVLKDAPSDADRSQPTAAAPQVTVEAATGDSPALLAMDSDRSRRAESASLPAAPAAASEHPPGRSSARRQADATAPKPDAAGASATASAGGSTAPVDRIGRSLVHIRLADGSYIGGVVLTPDGSILAAKPLFADGKPPTVILADGRGVSATVTRQESGEEWCRLRIDAAGLPAVTLAATAPADHATLTAVSTDRVTGTARSSPARAHAADAKVSVQWEEHSPTDDVTAFFFDAHGELLAMMPTPTVAKAQARADSRRGRSSPMLVRPFTAEERARLQPTR